MDLGKIISEFPAQLLYAALIALIFSGTGRIWSQVTHQKASAMAGMQMGQVMGGLPAPQPAPHPVAHPAARHGVNYGRVLLHIGVFQLAVNVVAFVIGFLLGALLLCGGTINWVRERTAPVYSGDPRLRHARPHHWLPDHRAACRAFDSLAAHDLRRPGTRRNDGSHQLVGGCLSSNQRRRFCRASHLRANSDVLWYGYRRWPLLPDRWTAGPSARADGPAIPLRRPTERPALSAAARPASLSTAISAAQPYYRRRAISATAGRAALSAAISSCWRPAALSAQRGPAASLPAAVSTATGSATASSTLSATAATRRRARREQPIRRASSHWLRRATLFLCRPSRIR